MIYTLFYSLFDFPILFLSSPGVYAGNTLDVSNLNSTYPFIDGGDGILICLYQFLVFLFSLFSFFSFGSLHHVSSIHIQIYQRLSYVFLIGLCFALSWFGRLVIPITISFFGESYRLEGFGA